MGNKTISKQAEKRIKKSRYVFKMMDYAEAYGRLSGKKLKEWIDKNYDDDFSSVSYCTFAKPSHRRSKQEALNAFQMAHANNWRVQILQILDVTTEDDQQIIESIYKFTCPNSKNPKKMVQYYFQYRGEINIYSGKWIKAQHKEYVDESKVQIIYDQPQPVQKYVPPPPPPPRVRTQPQVVQGNNYKPYYNNTYNTNQTSTSANQQAKREQQRRKQEQRRENERIQRQRRDRQERERRQKQERERRQKQARERRERDEQQRRNDEYRRQQEYAAQRQREQREQQRRFEQNMRRQQQNERQYRRQQQQAAEQRYREYQTALSKRNNY